MNQGLQPLIADRFLEAVLKYMDPLKGTHIHDPIIRDCLEKVDHVDAGYGQWIERLLNFLVDRYHLRGRRILDLGCGRGELTVRMKLLGYDAYGLDLHEKHLQMARILMAENGIQDNMFLLNQAEKLPFSDESLDIITMFSVLEHLSDSTLSWLLPELWRVNRGLVYVLVPNRLKPVDDHTGLRLVPWMPRGLASTYVRIRGKRYGYFISADGSWDVYYRSFNRIVSLFTEHGFSLDFPADGVIYPPPERFPSVIRIGRRLMLRLKTISIGMTIPPKIMRRGYPKQMFYPYLNLAFIRQKRGDR